ncbi:putative DNA binding protein 3 [Elsinoe australis]|uniref:Putative DNA binding protein 3 n=1 Tax=Elsinoe australis TaxID=40998 RepID=A0A4U7BBR9_9PEZI|nr:putative DNA binding protein 3 [Elsinoe australis]
MAYNWGQPPLPDGMPYQQTVPDAQYSMAYDQRLDPPMPQWPSQLTGDHSMYKTVAMPPLQSIPLIDPFASSSMPSASGPSNTPNPRRTLTDDDRRDMCRYAEAHPNLKQIEIGARFKVDRSTVSKVLRYKDKYLNSNSRSRSRPPLKREKSRKGEVEHALNSWATKQRKLKIPLTEESIQEQAARFANATGGSISNPATDPKWVAQFKRNYSLSARGKTPVKAEDAELMSNPDSPDSKSPSSALSPGVAGLRMITSNEDLRSAFSDSTTDPRSPSQPPSMSLSSALAQDPPNDPQDFFLQSSPYFSPVSGPPPDTFAHRNTRPLAPASRNSSDRQRRSTFPQAELNPYMSTSTSGAQLEKIQGALLDSPMNEYSSLLESPEEHFYSDYSNVTSNPTSAIDSATISPLDTLNAHAFPNRHRRTHSMQGPSQEEARAGLETAMRYLEKQSPGLLKTDEALIMAKVQQKLNNQP